MTPGDPTRAPSDETASPTRSPSADPTSSPTKNPLGAGQTANPSYAPSAEPSTSPSQEPTAAPTNEWRQCDGRLCRFELRVILRFVFRWLTAHSMDVSVAELAAKARCSAYWQQQEVAADNIMIEAESEAYAGAVVSVDASGEEFTEMAMTMSVWMATDSRPLKRQIRKAKHVSDYSEVFVLIEHDAEQECSDCGFEIVLDDGYASVETELVAKNKVNARDQAAEESGSSGSDSGGFGTTGILSVILVILVVLIGSAVALWFYVKKRAKDQQGLGARTFQHSFNSQKSMTQSAIDSKTLFGTMPQTQTAIVRATSNDYDAETEHLGQSYGGGAGALDL